MNKHFTLLHIREPPQIGSSAKSFQNSEKGENNKMNKAKKAFTRAFAVLLVFILLLVGLPVAASAAETTEVKLTLGDLLTYQEGIDWKTHMMYADGEMAYCVNPKLPAPSGTFTTTEKNCIELTAKDKNYNLLVKTLYYGYGGDGFSKKLSSVGKSMKSYMDSLRSTYWLTEKGTSLYYLMTHRVLAYFYGDPDWNYALTGDWKSAILKIVSAIKSESTVPSTTNLYILDTGNSKYQKVILSKKSYKASASEGVGNSRNHRRQQLLQPCKRQI